MTEIVVLPTLQAASLTDIVPIVHGGTPGVSGSGGAAQLTVQQIVELTSTTGSGTTLLLGGINQGTLTLGSGLSVSGNTLIANGGAGGTTDLSGYALETWVESQNYLTSNSTLAAANVNGLTPAAAAAAPVQKVANRTGTITLTHSDITDWSSATAGFSGTGGTTAAVATVPVTTAVTPTTDTVLVNIGGSGGATEQITVSNLLVGKTIDQGTSAAAVSSTDVFWVGQGTSTMLSQSFSAVWTWIMSMLPGYQKPVVEVTTSIPLDRTTTNGRVLIVTATGVTLSAIFANMGSGYETTIINAASGPVTFGAGITGANGATTIPAGQRCTVNAYTTSQGSVVLAVVGGGTVVAAPNQPINLAVGAVGTTTIAVAWSPATSGGTPSGYTLQYQLGSGGSWTQVTGLSNANYTITGLTASTAYNIQVCAVNGGGNSAFTSSLSASTSATLQAPGQTTNLISTAQSANTISLSWTAPTTGGTPASYTLGYRLTSTGGAYTTANTNISGTTYVVTGLTTATAYDFQVYAVNAVGSGNVATVAAISTTILAPGQVTGLTAGTVTYNTISLTWTAPSTGGTPASYSVTANGITTTGIAGTSTTLTGLTAATKYTITVTAVNSGGSGTASTTLSVTTSAAPAPMAVISVAPSAIGVVGSAMTFNLTYTGASGAITATVDSVAVSPSALTATGSGAASFTLSGLTAGSHTLSVTGASGSAQTTQFWVQSTSVAYNVLIAGSAPCSTTYTAGFPGTIPAGPALWFINGGNGSFVSGTQPSQWVSSSNIEFGLSTSLVTPPSAGIMQGTSTNGTYGQFYTAPNVYSANTFYLWVTMVDPSGNKYAFVYTTPIVVT